VTTSGGISRRVQAGAWLWIAAVQFYVVQPVVAATWTSPYSLTLNYISDLGSTACVAATANYVAVCSPWHALMNASFVLVGVTMAGGAVLASPAFLPGRLRTSATALFILAGIGTVVVGLYPENDPRRYHYDGAAVNFIAGNLALIVYAAVTARAFRGFRFASMFAGVVGLVSTALVATGHFAGLGAGGIERLAAYPVSLWQIGAGIQILRRMGDGDSVQGGAVRGT
jgi:hypothetical membrane protein